MNTSCTLFFVSFIYLTLFVAAAADTGELCSNIIAFLDCAKDPDTLTCASNGTTFRTKCDFAKAHCEDGSLHLLHAGRCEEGEVPQADPACRSLLALQCPRGEGSVEVCASDAVTYPSLCEFEKARCGNQTLQLAALGSCVFGGNTVLEAICAAVLNEDCPGDDVPVCGSDGVTYGNACEFEKARCRHPDQTLQLSFLGSCVFGGNTVLEAICTAVLNEDCPNDDTPVCGSDDVTYGNACKLEKEACKKLGLHLIDDKACHDVVNGVHNSTARP